MKLGIMRPALLLVLSFVVATSCALFNAENAPKTVQATMDFACLFANAEKAPDVVLQLCKIVGEKDQAVAKSALQEHKASAARMGCSAAPSASGK